MIRRHVLTFVVALLGMLVALGGWHVYLDHLVFHALINMAQQQAQQQARPTPQRPGPTP